MFPLSRNRDEAGKWLMFDAYRAALGAFALVVLLTNESQALLFLQRASARLALLPIGGATARDLHHATQDRTTKLPLMLLGELVSHCRRTVKIPAAFFRISFSSLRRASLRCI